MTVDFLDGATGWKSNVIPVNASLFGVVGISFYLAQGENGD